MSLQRVPLVLAALLAIAPVAASGRAAAPSLVFRHIPTRERVVAITINDGPDTRIVPAMLRLLQESGNRATFFVTAAALRDDPAILLEIRDAGSEVENHTYHHRSLTRLPYRKVDDEVGRAQRFLGLAVAQPPQFLRPPYGKVDRQVREVARRYRLRIALWDVGEPNETLAAVPEHLHPGDILSLRDDREGLRRLREIVAALEQQHFRSVTLRELTASGR